MAVQAHSCARGKLLATVAMIERLGTAAAEFVCTAIALEVHTATLGKSESVLALRAVNAVFFKKVRQRLSLLLGVVITLPLSKRLARHVFVLNLPWFLTHEAHGLATVSTSHHQLTRLNTVDAAAATSSASALAPTEVYVGHKMPITQLLCEEFILCSSHNDAQHRVEKLQMNVSIVGHHVRVLAVRADPARHVSRAYLNAVVALHAALTYATLAHGQLEKLTGRKLA